MRKEQKDAIFHMKKLSELYPSEELFSEICKHMASTHGPLVISSMIEHGLKELRDESAKRKKKKRAKK